MDDIFRMTESVKAAQEGNIKMEYIVGSKGLDLNIDKSNFTLIGNKKARKKLRAEMEKEPLTLCGHPMKEVKQAKFLGDYFSFSLEDSIHQTVLKGLVVQSSQVLKFVLLLKTKDQSRSG